MKRLLKFVVIFAVPTLALGTSTSAATIGQTDLIVLNRLTGKISRIPLAKTLGKIDPHVDERLTRAGSIAYDRANPKKKDRCWQYVKEALVASGVVAKYPDTNLAYEAGPELVNNHGFVQLPIKDPYAAPVGAVLVYRYHETGHVEIRTPKGFASYYRSQIAFHHPLIGVFVKITPRSKAEKRSNRRILNKLQRSPKTAHVLHNAGYLLLY